MTSDTYWGRLPLSIGQKLQRIHWPVVFLLCAISGVGVASLYSVADGSITPWAERHTLRFLLGLGLVFWLAMTPREFWVGFAYPAYAIMLALLAAVPFLGVEGGGAIRWLSFGDLRFQPSELMKITLVLALARYYQWLPVEQISRPQWLVPPLLMIAAPVAFTLKQPDLGTAVLFAVVGLGLMFMAGVNFFYFLGAGIAAIAAMPLVWAHMHDYQRRRVEVFLNPDADPLGAGYHITQSKIALGSGGLSGKGFLKGTQSQLDFLPEKHTDFIFPTFGEEWGFVGAVFLLACFALLVSMLLIMSLRCASQFARLTIAGAALIVFVYVFINIAMVTGLVPVVGVPLPLVSYGGTSMLTVMLAIGLAMCAYVHRGRGFRRVDLGAFF
ncbi:MAG: rod shape-determining protein RodA [Hyphomicrobiaceae bacterium]|nr:rod shape-determining protein RodA [Hyphomicrobiaceae bacterium]